MTPEPLPPLLLKATPELLDGWCGPVVLVPDTAAPVPCVVLGRDDAPPDRRAGDWLLMPQSAIWPDAVCPFPDAEAMAVSGPCGDDVLYLDLSRAECRDRVARVLAGHDAGCWRYVRAWLGWTLTLAAQRVPVAPFWVYRKRCSWDPPGRFGGREAPRTHIVPALADLDPNDPRTLPDGSRWVDAAALLAVWEARGA